MTPVLPDNMELTVFSLRKLALQAGNCSSQHCLKRLVCNNGTHQKFSEHVNLSTTFIIILHKATSCSISVAPACPGMYVHKQPGKNL